MMHEQSPEQGQLPQEQVPDMAPEALLREVNIAEKLNEEKRIAIGMDVKKGYETDLASRSEWEQKLDEWQKLALQVRETKTYPWPGASNVKYPILSTAAMQFAARAYPALVPANGNIVNYRVIGEDQGGVKAAKAKRVSQYMSWQVLEQMSDWEEDMDRLLIMLPIVGCAFKKTWWNDKLKRSSSNLVHPKDLVINYWATSLEKCERKTQKYLYSKRELLEKMRREEFLEVDLTGPNSDMLPKQDKFTGITAGEDDDATPYLVLEQHTFLDLDKDDYPEPYIVTILHQTGELLRISARWDSDGVKKNEKGKIVCIEPVEYFTKFPFIPNPDGGFYDIGFGLLLGPINESVNTIINQLIDSGHMASLGGGWISKGLRIKQGNHKFSPNEWKQVDATFDDIKKGIFPLPVREPSNVLFQLLGSLIQSSKELASVAEIFTGKMPGQNTPATTTMATIEQGMKVFTAIYKRVYRSLQREFKKLYRLNGIYLDTTVEQNIVDEQIGPQDYESKSYDVCPSADPQATTKQEKLVKAQALMELLQLGTIDPMAVTLRILEAQEQENPESLLPKGPPPPDPKVAIEQMKAQMEQQKMQYEMQLKQQEAQMKEKESQLKMQMDGQMHAQKLQFEEAKMMLEMKGKMAEHQLNVIQRKDEMEMGKQEHKVEMVKGVEKHSQDMEMSKEKHEKDMSQKKEKSKE